MLFRSSCRRSSPVLRPTPPSTPPHPRHLLYDITTQGLPTVAMTPPCVGPHLSVIHFPSYLFIIRQSNKCAVLLSDAGSYIRTGDPGHASHRVAHQPPRLPSLAPLPFPLPPPPPCLSLSPFYPSPVYLPSPSEEGDWLAVDPRPCPAALCPGAPEERDAPPPSDGGV